MIFLGFFNSSFIKSIIIHLLGIIALVAVFYTKNSTITSPNGNNTLVAIVSFTKVGDKVVLKNTLTTKQNSKAVVKEPEVNKENTEPSSSGDTSSILDYNNLLSSGLLQQTKFFPPEYPFVAKSNGWQGMVLLRATITLEGKIANSSIYNSSGYKILDNAALAVVIGWEFNNFSEQAIDVFIPINFTIK